MNEFRTGDEVTIRDSVTRQDVKDWADWPNVLVNAILKMRGRKLVVKRVVNLYGGGVRYEVADVTDTMYYDAWPLPPEWLVPFKKNDVVMEVDDV